MIKWTFSRSEVPFLVVTSHFSGVVTKIFVVANSRCDNWISPVDYLVFMCGNLVVNF